MAAQDQKIKTRRRVRSSLPASANTLIRIRGARVHNLKNVSVDIPKNKLVVVTGLSGSGKSSLAFDTLYAEAERRFVESLSSYARQFLGVADKPDVDSIDGLSPAISIDQKSVSKNPRSTVGTITEIYDYMRILFSRIGKPHCPVCGKPVGRQSVEHITDKILAEKGEELMILGPLVSGKKGEHRAILEEVKSAGYLRVRVDGVLWRLDDSALAAQIEKKQKHTIEVVVDRFVMSKDIDRSRIADSIETALKIGKGIVVVVVGKEKAPGKKSEDLLFSENFACVECGVSLPELEPRLFSFNSPHGACPYCTGLGELLEVDPALVLPNKNLTLAEGAIRPWAGASHRVGRQSWYWWLLEDLAGRHNFSLETPVGKLPQRVVDILLYGEEEVRPSDQKSENVFEGVIPNLKRRWKETDSEWTRAEIEKYMIIKSCEVCRGKRLKREALGVKIAGKNIADAADLSVSEARIFVDAMLHGTALGSKEIFIASGLLKEIGKRLRFLADVGLEYLTLSRASTTLAGGEAQRIRLATQIGSELSGIMYILDEPSIGLHPRDHGRLIVALKRLRDLGNSVIVVEHDAETMRQSDWIIDLGPGAGKHGGTVMFAGTYRDLLRAKTLTGEYLSGRKKVVVAKNQQPTTNNQQQSSVVSRELLVIKGAREHNLKNIDVRIPLGKLIAMTGVSGSGKSTLVGDILAKSLMVKLHQARAIPGAHDKILGAENLDKVVVVDQSPIGRTPRSNPATYTGAFSVIREIFSATLEARARGFTPGRFSFNVKGGRCEACEGQGVKKIEMYFLPDVYVECEECKGRRYNREALTITYKGLDISQVLQLTIEEALEFFKNIPAVYQKLKMLYEVGLGYMKLGQASTTLSGGEAQRTKLAAELARRDTGRTLYILDEPTTGLHFEDIQKLLLILRLLVDRGNTVLVIEHNIDVIKNMDWIIDLGPEGGDGGGFVVAEGSPAEIASQKKSYTGQWLKKK
ncbi:MAG: excinuclease ABC subunit UvrA [Candidatus Sungbacteria bacterium]|nr:excinuclease ABC subunit UvrA [Candidatus Sungbacteria bacterium]